MKGCFEDLIEPERAALVDAVGGEAGEADCEDGGRSCTPTDGVSTLGEMDETVSGEVWVDVLCTAVASERGKPGVGVLFKSARRP